MEDLAQRGLADPAWYGLLDAVCRAKTITLAELLRARNTGALEGLKRSLHDPLLSEAAGAFLSASERTRAVRVG